MSRLNQHLKSQVLALLLFHCSYTRATRPAMDVLSALLDRLIHHLLKNLHQDFFSSSSSSTIITASRVLDLAGPLIGRNIGDLNEYIYGVSHTTPKTPLSFLQDRRLLPMDLLALQCTRNLVQNSQNPPVSFIDDELCSTTDGSIDATQVSTTNASSTTVEAGSRRTRSKRSRN